MDLDRTVRWIGLFLAALIAVVLLTISSVIGFWYIFQAKLFGANTPSFISVLSAVGPLTLSVLLVLLYAVNAYISGQQVRIQNQQETIMEKQQQMMAYEFEPDVEENQSKRSIENDRVTLRITNHGPGDARYLRLCIIIRTMRQHRNRAIPQAGRTRWQNVHVLHRDASEQNSSNTDPLPTHGIKTKEADISFVSNTAFRYWLDDLIETGHLEEGEKVSIELHI